MKMNITGYWTKPVALGIKNKNLGSVNGEGSGRLSFEEQSVVRGPKF